MTPTRPGRRSASARRATARPIRCAAIERLARRHRHEGAAKDARVALSRPSPRWPMMCGAGCDERPVSAGRDAFRYRTQRLPRRHRAALAVAALLLAAIVVTAVAVNRWAKASRPSAAAGTGKSPPATTLAPRPSVAVAGFTNLSGRAADQWLSTAMAEMLTTELAGGGQVRVVPADLVTRAARDTGWTPPAARRPTRLSAYARRWRRIIWCWARSRPARAAPPRVARIDVRVLRKSEEPVSVSGVGDEAPALRDDCRSGHARFAPGSALKQSPTEATSGARAAFPQSIEAMQLYSEGLAGCVCSRPCRRTDAVRAGGSARARQSADPDRARLRVDRARLRQPRQGRPRRQAFDSSAR